MARPTKKGLDYFPLDVDFLSDIKVKRVIRACGKESIHILIALLCNIYREEGYYILWNDDLAFLVADEVGAKEGTVEELIKKSVQVGLFDKMLFDKHKILTSKGIQNRYITATKERKEVVLESDYLLTNEVNRPNILVNRSKNPVNLGSNQQSKEKESKEKKNKENSSSAREEVLQTFLSYQKLWYFPNDFQRQDLMELIGIYGDDLVDAAIKVAGTKDVKKSNAINFIESCLQEWADANVMNLEQAREYQRQRGKKNQQSRQPYHQAPQKVEEMPDWSARKESKLTPEQQAEMAELEKMFND
ncbi:Lin1244/Lin1753 domain-containing protein [Enterococcus dispar]|uniref:Lin1244/Lin1753 domain-containing protein n=1 Tax=Enterococcus dispar TaxID=44009 RepID=UPI00288E5E7C|nr:Lin1244/Lin1753 domain-containing protein [Enterococcus dispar]MDT2704783.1 DUF4373 domain-containing protein [Enterococcus dispar]